MRIVEIIMKEFHLDENTSKWLRDENKKEKVPCSKGLDNFSLKENLINNENQTFYVISINPKRENVTTIFQPWKQ